MDIYDYLKKDHAKVSKLFKLFEKTNDNAYREEIFELINTELTLHAESEQATFYAALEAYKENIEDVNHAEKEHDDIEKQLDKISSMESRTTNWVKAVLKLKEIVEHHVSEEEGKIFRDAKKVFPEEEAIALKEQMHDMKDKILEKIRHGVEA